MSEVNIWGNCAYKSINFYSLNINLAKLHFWPRLNYDVLQIKRYQRISDVAPIPCIKSLSLIFQKKLLGVARSFIF